MKTKNVIIAVSAMCLVFALVSCGGGGNKCISKPESWEDITIVTKETNVPETEVCPAYTILEKTQYSLSKFAKDKDCFYILFDGKTFNGWRGYNRDNVPKKWVIDEGTIKFSGGGTGESQEDDGGDLIFGRKFKNFEFSIDWKVSPRGNSGIFYFAREIKGQPIYISAPESQVLDNAGHIDGRTPKNAASSLYDMIAAEPQNANPAGERNNTTIIVDRGNVYHFQNGVRVVSYNVGNQKWTELLQSGKFSQERWPLAFELLNQLGPNSEGYIGLQDHGDDVWFRNIKIKILD